MKRTDAVVANKDNEKSAVPVAIIAVLVMKWIKVAIESTIPVVVIVAVLAVLTVVLTAVVK